MGEAHGKREGLYTQKGACSGTLASDRSLNSRASCSDFKSPKSLILPCHFGLNSARSASLYPQFDSPLQKPESATSKPRKMLPSGTDFGSVVEYIFADANSEKVTFSGASSSTAIKIAALPFSAKRLRI